MKYLNGHYYIKDQRQKIHPTKKSILGLRDELKPLRFQYRVQNSTQIRKNQKVIK